MGGDWRKTRKSRNFAAELRDTPHFVSTYLLRFPMLFNSIEFAVFLVVVFLLYWFVFNRQERVRNLFVIAVSYLFYGWWDWRFLLLIAFTSLCSFVSGLVISSSHRLGRQGKARWVCGLNVAVNLTILCLFKYYNFFMTEFAARFLDGDTSGLLVKLVLPVGISFYTFQALSYSIDVYRRKLEATSDVTAFFAYIAFSRSLWPGLSSAPQTCCRSFTACAPLITRERSTGCAASCGVCSRRWLSPTAVPSWSTRSSPITPRCRAARC